MRYLLMAIAAFIITLPTISYAEQVVIKESVWRGGHAYTVNVENALACIDAAENISNLNIHSNEGNFDSRKLFTIRFICIDETGTIHDSGTFYQLPFSLNSPESLTCLRWGSFGGFYLTDICDNGNFMTRAVLIRKGTLHGYITSFEED